MGAKFWNADTQRSRAAFKKMPDEVKAEIGNMIRYAETWKEADLARLEAAKSNHMLEEALQKMIDVSDTRQKADNTLSVCSKYGKKKTEAFAKLKKFDDKTAETREQRVKKAKSFFGL